METVEYGRTGIRVSRLCFGTGHLARMPDAEGARLLRYAFDHGVTFWDTALSYDSHRHVRTALHDVARADVVINTKTGAHGFEEGLLELERALRELGTSYVDTMLLHGVADADDFAARQGCLEALLEGQRRGHIRTVGLSSHLYTGEIIDVARDDDRIEVLLSSANPDGAGLQIGDVGEHMRKLGSVSAAGKGVSIMKLLAAGERADRAEEWLAWGFAQSGVHVVNVGLTGEAQIDTAVAAAGRVLVPA